ncbi:MAG: outer membrane beta-barrel protein [Deltaproteobacteria bacterium]|nr:outer membrane beta-barrel protein [Deltaproteobacteria bacterium]
MLRRATWVWVSGALSLAPGLARAQQQPTPPTPSRPEAVPPSRGGAGRSVGFGGYIEGFYSYNFNRPSSGLNELRYYDRRHDLFSLQNVVLSADWALGPVYGRVALQTGVITETVGTPAGSARTLESDLLWRVLQEATASWRTPLGHGVTLDAGLYVAPFTIEDLSVHDNWNWSTSTLFALSPTQVAGARVTVPLGCRHELTLGLFNGWDQITDDRTPGKTGILTWFWVDRPAGEGCRDNDDEDLETMAYASVQYGLGAERELGAPEGPAVRQVVDAWAHWPLGARVSVDGNFFGAYERNRFGHDYFAGLALYARVQLSRWLYAAVRADAVFERVPDGASGMFLDGASVLGSGTVTLDARPHPNVSLRLEYRHDESDGALFHRGTVMQSTDGAWIANARGQDTLLVGMTTWYP